MDHEDFHAAADECRDGRDLQVPATKLHARIEAAVILPSLPRLCTFYGSDRMLVGWFIYLFIEKLSSIFSFFKEIIKKNNLKKLLNKESNSLSCQIN